MDDRNKKVLSGMLFGVVCGLMWSHGADYLVVAMLSGMFYIDTILN